MRSAPKKLTQKDIEKRLKKITDWSINTKQTELVKTFQFSNFVNGLGFVAKIAVHAEILNHHPEITLSYGKVKILLSTDEVKGITALDFELAKRIDSIKMNM